MAWSHCMLIVVVVALVRWYAFGAATTLAPARW
jgi:hypothetical protein